MLASLWKASTLFATTAILMGGYAEAQAVFNQLHTVAASDRAVPVEHSFTVQIPGSYVVTLTDLGMQLTPQAPLASVKLAITSASTIAGPPITTLNAAGQGTTSFSAMAAGTYIIHVVGQPGSDPHSGKIGIQVTDTNNNPIASFSDTLALPSNGLASNEAVVDASFTAAAGTYQVNLSDLQLPAALNVVTMVIVDPNGAIVPGSTLSLNPLLQASQQVTLATTGTYRIFAVGQSASSGLNAGLYGLNVTPQGSASSVFSATMPVGLVSLVGTPALSAGQYTLTASDLGFPAALTQFGAIVSLDGNDVASVNVPSGSPATFTAVSTTYQVFALGVAATLGSYAVALLPASGPAALSVARALPAADGSAYGFSFDTNATGLESYTLRFADFGIPAAFSSVTAAAVQGSTILGGAQGTLRGSGSVSVTPAAGAVSILVFAQPQSASGIGLFGLDWTASGAPTATFEVSQGVGPLFSQTALKIDTAGNYDVTVSDVGFPAAFSDLAVIVTRGAVLVGSIIGGGKFSFPATTGQYSLNFIAQPGGSDHAGTYAMSVAPSPPAPVVSLKSSAINVTSGSTVTLTWSAQNATACTASGAWSGAEPLSGSFATPALTSQSTFTLTCSGSGGSNSQSVTVSIAPPEHGGGGALNLPVLIALCGSLGARLLMALRLQSLSNRTS